MDNNIFKTQVDKKTIEVRINSLAEKANGSVLIKCGETTLLVTAIMSKTEPEGINFFPLNVAYEERYYAAGKILGSRFMRREGRPSDRSILISRLIDRAIRPLFPQWLKREVQIIITCLSWDEENDPAVLGLLGASIALITSDIPWNGPVAPIRIAKNSKITIFPDYSQREDGDFDSIFSFVKSEKDVLINMIDGGFKEASENDIEEGIREAKKYAKQLLEFQGEISKKFIQESDIKIGEKDILLEKELEEKFSQKIEDSLSSGNFSENEYLIKEEIKSFVDEKYEKKTSYALNWFEEDLDKKLHVFVLKNTKRIDGRKIDEVRDLSCDVTFLPRTHGSALFKRGLTTSLSILTLGAPGDQKLTEEMEMRGKKRFMHHYNFPPYSVGEARMMRGPGRREIGHGMLAEKALSAVIPDFDEFPYTIRIVSEIVCSNGSSSMASTCSSSLALMDAGVPIKRPVAGIAMGLITDPDENKSIEERDYKILTDIQGPEDHYGDMDFKVAGTQKGICALQMDTKIKGVTEKILKEAMIQARETRLQILDVMKKKISAPRDNLSEFAPRVFVIQIKPDKIREVIGPGGKMINEIIDECKVSIDIEEDGRVYITGDQEEAAKKAVDWVKNIVREIKPGELFKGKVTRILNFGAFVEIVPGQEGLVHISQLSQKRVKRVEDVVKIGDVIPVKVTSIDEQGRINLSLKDANNS